MHQIDPQQSADPTAAGAWSRYYQAPLTLFDIIGNLYGQREFISELTGLPPTAKLLEVGSGS